MLFHLFGDDCKFWIVDFQPSACSSTTFSSHFLPSRQLEKVGGAPPVPALWAVLAAGDEALRRLTSVSAIVEGLMIDLCS